MSRVNTGVKDCAGHAIYEGDYVKLIKGERNANSNWCGDVGIVAWDYRRKEFQVLTMQLPSTKIVPKYWGQFKADYLNDASGKLYYVVNDEFSASERHWKPKTFFSGGIEISFSKKADGLVYKGARYEPQKIWPSK